MTDPQNDKPCRDCGALTQHDTERCDDCRTPAGRLVTALTERGVKAKADKRGNVRVDGQTFVASPAIDGGEVWDIVDVHETLDEAITAQADAIAAIVKAANPNPFDAIRRHLQGEAIREHGNLINEHADLQTQTEGAMDALRPHTSHDNVCRAAQDVVEQRDRWWRLESERTAELYKTIAERDTLAAEVKRLRGVLGRIVPVVKLHDCEDGGFTGREMRAIEEAISELAGGVHPLPDEVRS